MSLLNRRVTRTILNTTESTAETNSISSNALAFVLTTTDSFYMGYHHKFAARYIDFGTVNTNAATLSVAYWNGTSFSAVEDLVDGTEGGTQDGFISWQNKDDWTTVAQTPIDDVKLYWIRVQTDTNFSAGTTIQSLLNLFSDDNMLRVYYPELITNSTFLPASRTDFLEQHLAAKDMVVQRLQQRRLIKEEGQIIDPNAVSAAAVHAAAFLIVNPIARSEDTIVWANRIKNSFDEEIGQLNFEVDQNSDGILSDAERRDISSTMVFRR